MNERFQSQFLPTEYMQQVYVRFQQLKQKEKSRWPAEQFYNVANHGGIEKAEAPIQHSIGQDSKWRFCIDWCKNQVFSFKIPYIALQIKTSCVER